jgi:hypothetical protein
MNSPPFSMGDHERQMPYEQQALPFAKDYRFAAYNFARLLLGDGQLIRAERYAAGAYWQSMTLRVRKLAK